MLLDELNESLSGDIVGLTMFTFKCGEEVELTGSEHETDTSLGDPCQVGRDGTEALVLLGIPRGSGSGQANAAVPPVDECDPVAIELL